MSNNCDMTPKEKADWKAGAIVYTIGSGTYVKSNHSNGNTYDSQCPIKPQSPETTAIMKRSLEHQYKTK